MLDLLLLSVLAALLYLPGLDTHGVTNWQEAQRLVVARDMQDRWHAGEGIAAWLVPTRDRVPYLAKPPLIYWAQLALAEPFGERVELWHMRLAVALGGILAVLATYLAARVLLESRSAAWWSAALVATGVLSTRSARIGELDVFLMPLCTLAIAWIAVAWRHARRTGKTRWRAVGAAAACGSMAVLTKDPAVMVIGFGGFAAMALYHASRPEPGGPHRRAARPWLRAGLSMAAALAGAAAASFSIRRPGEVAGAAIIGLGLGILVYAILPLLNISRLGALAKDLSRTHPLIVLGVPVLIRIGWAVWVDRLVGGSASGRSAAIEAEDNLRLFVAEAPLNNLEAAAYGVGVGSVAAIAVLIWVLRARPRLTPSGAHLAAWIGLGLLAFSILGKGVPRYLTPLWPAIAIVGGWGVHELITRMRASLTAPWLPTAVAAGLVVLGFGQTAWYAYGREAVQSSRCPRAMVESLTPKLTRKQKRRVFSFEFATPALDYYLSRLHGRIRVLGDPKMTVGMSAGTELWSTARLHAALGRARTIPPVCAIVLLRDDEAARERLRSAGFVLEPIDGLGVFTIDSGRSRIVAVRATASSQIEMDSSKISPPKPR